LLSRCAKATWWRRWGRELDGSGADHEGLAASRAVQIEQGEFGSSVESGFRKSATEQIRQIRTHEEEPAQPGIIFNLRYGQGDVKRLLLLATRFADRN
jgi:hypothetical protein